MLKLRRGTVVSVEPLMVQIGSEKRPAWADTGLVGECLPGDELILNTEALDLALGSGGFDIVHVNLTRGLEGPGADVEHIMKLNYTSLQHPVHSIERSVGDDGSDAVVAGAGGLPVLAIGLHGHLAPAAWAAGRTGANKGRNLRIAYIQTGGGALPGSFSRDVEALVSGSLIVEHVTAGPAYGGPSEAVSLVGALDSAGSRGWDAVIAGPGPGILGSATHFGHGGMAALDVLHGAIALGMPSLLSPRLSQADPRPRHRGLSHHSDAVLSLVIEAVEVPLPEGSDAVAERVGRLAGGRHHITTVPVDLAGYAASGYTRSTMGRDIDEDPVFFAAPLAAGRRLAELACL